MSKVRVPLKFVYKCDCCEETVDLEVDFKPKSWGRLTLIRDALDGGGNPVAADNVCMDLCTKCTLLIVGAINRAQKELLDAAEMARRALS